jgi:hypothetical protein
MYDEKTGVRYSQKFLDDIKINLENIVVAGSGTKVASL